VPGCRRGWVVGAAASLAFAACAGSPAVRSAGPGTSAPPASTLRPPVPETTTVVVAPSTSTIPPAFSGTVGRVTAADLPSSWRAGCPVGPDDLRVLSLSYWGFDDRAHAGTMVVRASVAQAVVDVFHRLYDHRFPIRRMEPVDVFGGSDDASIAADNTAGFNCRNAVASGPPQWSAHAYGEAIDVNPVENPYLEGGRILPPEGAAYQDRSVLRPGMAVRGGELNAAFAAAGWYWGGAWSSPDYQHFSATGG
jgi:hypothetical protein